MKENFDESELDDYTKKSINDQIAESLEKKKLKAQWRKAINENEKIQAYFANFLPSSVESFIDRYLSKKYQAYKYGAFFAERLERLRTKWIMEANGHLEAILQKKLFDLQCLWRAEQITLEGVAITFDFTVWQNNIFNCPFLEVDEQDITLYQAFLSSGEIDRYSNAYYEWQEYEEFKKGDSEMPEWYDFHNLRTGNGALLLLPDIRGKKEDFYMHIFHVNDPKMQENRQHVSDGRPMLFMDEQDFFVNTFEEAEHRKNIQEYQRYYDRRSENIDELIMDMNEIEENIPIESHYDYREAIELAYNKYFLGKISDHLPIAYEQYLFNKSMNLQVPVDEHYNFYLELKATYYERILKGREMNGEPRDLNF